MEKVKVENKVVEYEIITTKKFRQVVKVQFDEKYSDELNETKITPSDIGFGLGEEIEGDETKTFSTKIVNEPPDEFITYTYIGETDTIGKNLHYQGTNRVMDETKKILGWGNFVPTKTKSVLLFKSYSNCGNNNGNKIIYLTCSMNLVEQLWRSSKLKELSSYIIKYGYDRDADYLYDEYEVDNGLDFLTLIHKKRNGYDVKIWTYEVQKYIEFGKMVFERPFLFCNSNNDTQILLENQGNL